MAMPKISVFRLALDVTEMCADDSVFVVIRWSKEVAWDAPVVARLALKGISASGVRFGIWLFMIFGFEI